MYIRGWLDVQSVVTQSVAGPQAARARRIGTQKGAPRSSIGKELASISK